ncbi:cupin domain-containing protein [Mycolicibacterium cosmeticum]|uniref:cupin domain-containing protein n=1 Tax=Mycolicibacterium cosmeticum TaxID=258533 RepID=UPI003204AE10
MTFNRRLFLGGAGAVGAAAAGGLGLNRALSPETTTEDPSMTMSDNRFGDPRIPAETITNQSHLFHLGAMAPLTFDGGNLRQASEDNFPILAGQQASAALVTLQPGAIREPHWHPSAWEINVVTAGTATWTVLDPQGNTQDFEARTGDLVFAPQGSLHYFENRGSEELQVVIVFNASTAEGKDDIGIGAALTKLPARVLGAVFGVDAKTFDGFKKIDNSLTILRP